MDLLEEVNAFRGWLQILSLLNHGPRTTARAGQAKYGVFCEGFPRPGRQRCKGMFNPQFLTICVFDQGFRLVRIGVVAAQNAQPAPFLRSFCKKVKFSYDIKISIPVVCADHDGAGLGKTTGNMPADAPETNVTGAFLLPQQVGLMKKQPPVPGCPAQKQRLLVELLFDWSAFHCFVLGAKVVRHPF